MNTSRASRRPKGRPVSGLSPKSRAIVSRWVSSGSRATVAEWKRPILPIRYWLQRPSGRGPTRGLWETTTSRKTDGSESGMRTSRASRCRLSSRGAGPNPPSPRASPFLTRNSTPRSKNSRAIFITSMAICDASFGRRSSSSRFWRTVNSRESSSADGREGSAEGAGGERGGRCGGRQARDHVGDQLVGEGPQVRLELVGVELGESRLEDDPGDPHLLRARLEGRAEALRHHQH